MTILVSLIGEQAIPNLLPIRYLKPSQVLMIYTKRTEEVKERLKSIFENPSENYPAVEVLKSLETPPFDIQETQKRLKQWIEAQKMESADLIFNLTGGTKPMALAAQQLTFQLRSPFVYLQTQGNTSMLHYYTFSKLGELQTEIKEIPPLLTIEDHLRAYLGKYQTKPLGNDFEKMVYPVIAPPIVDECKTSVTHGGALEIDLVMRIGNQIGIAEIKSGKKAEKKEGIDQLTTAAAQRYLGTYTKKFLIVDRKLGTNNAELAQEHHIEVIELLSAQQGNLSQEDKELLINKVRIALGGK